MEYMPNGSLKDYLARNRNISMTQRLRWVQKAAGGLQLLHSVNVIYCDVAPKNFLLDADLSSQRYSGISHSEKPGTAGPVVKALYHSVPDRSVSMLRGRLVAYSRLPGQVHHLLMPLDNPFFFKHSRQAWHHSRYLRIPSNYNYNLLELATSTRVRHIAPTCSSKPLRCWPI